MTLHRRWSVSLSSAMWIALALVIWAVFAPIPLGGNSAYVIVSGISMEPNFHLGDLVIVSPSSQYGVGDAIVYRNQEMGGINVFHRIIELNRDRYVLQGDNNSWIDTYQPTRSEVLGKLWIHIPVGGKFLERVRTPAGMALLGGVLGLLLVTGSRPERRKGKTKMNRNVIREWLASTGKKISSRFAERRQETSPSPKQPFSLGAISEILFLALGIIAFSSLILAILSFSRPAFRTVMDNMEYQQSGVFSYSAKSPKGVYDLDTIQSGDPLFPKLTCKVDFDFQYTLLAEKVKNIEGAHQLTAIIADPRSGWKRVLALQQVTPFKEKSFTTSATVNLCEIAFIVQSFEENSEAAAVSYELTISPQTSVSASMDGTKFQDTFEDGLKLIYDHNQFYVAEDTEGGDPFKPVKTGMVGREREEADVLSFLGLNLEIPSLRLFSTIGLAVSLTAMAFLWQASQRLSETDQAGFIRAKFESMLVDVEKVKFGTSKSMVDVSTFDDLAKLAERYNVMIMHEAKRDAHIYYVQSENAVYRYMLDVKAKDSDDNS